jgi:hypothetical protein
MNKFEIELNLKHVAEARAQYNAAAKEFGLRVDKAMKRLIHEAAAQRMSVPQVAKLSGFTTAQIKSRMKAMDLNPTTGRTLLSKQAADVLANNAEILGIEPHEVDLMSPLAYLPAGSLLKEKVSSVTDLDDGVPGNKEPVARGYWCESCGFFEDAPLELVGTGEGRMCQACGCDDSFHRTVNVVNEDDGIKPFPETDPWLERLTNAYRRGYSDRQYEKTFNAIHAVAEIMAQADEVGA